MIENECIKSGCKGFCCINTDIEVTLSERRRLFPRAVRLNTLKELRSGYLLKDICFYARLRTNRLGQSGIFEVGWNGFCPNLSPEGSCIKFDEREHAARNFKFGSDKCNQVRVENGLSSIFTEQV